ncbi:MAG: lysylphosphatidylglycerol synthase transmembrane domain-containing protein [Polyangiaceae bacterium]|nr:lysylphosphatidylglycerol synthase transmembrane domain-containing protein [Polyangiaceae bacterium]
MYRRSHATLAVLVALGLLAWTFRHAQLDQIAALLARLHPAALPLVLVPYALAVSSEASGWRSAILRLGHRVPFWRLLGVRLKTEALSLTLPLGQLVCDSATPALLQREGLPLAAGVAAVGVRKYLLALSQALFLLFAFFLGHSALTRASQKLVGSAVLQWLPLLAALMLGAVAIVLGSALSRGALATFTLRVLLRVPSEAFRRVLFPASPHFSETDSTLQLFFRRRVSPTQVARIMLVGVMESVETWVILSLLNADLSLSDVIGFEVLLSFMRSLVILVPAGLGIQDLGYLAFFRALGVADPVSTAAAFSLLKRGKELFWAGIGYGLFALRRPFPLTPSNFRTNSTL